MGFKVINPEAPRQAVDDNLRLMAERLRDDVASLSPRFTGRLASSWKLEKDHEASYTVSTDVPYAVFVEYGTRHMRGAHMLGRAKARARP